MSKRMKSKSVKRIVGAVIDEEAPKTLGVLTEEAGDLAVKRAEIRAEIKTAVDELAQVHRDLAFAIQRRAKAIYDEAGELQADFNKV